MKGYLCVHRGARARRLFRQTPAVVILFALFSGLFFFSPAQALAQKTAPFGKQFIPAQPIVSTTVVISQFQVAGGTAADEFVELHNVGSSSVDLNGYRLVYRSATGSSDVAVVNWTTATTIPAGGYYLIASSVGYDDTVTPNITFTSGGTGLFSGTAGGFALRNGAANTGAVIDSLGYGSSVTNGFVEGAATSAPAANASRARNSNGCADTDNNSTDFAGVNPSAPRNLSSSVNICGGGGGTTNPSGTGAANPNSVAAGNATLLTVAVTPGANPTSTGIAVTANLSAIGGSSSQTFFDDGTNGDATAGDNIFSYQATVAAGTSAGAKSLPVTVTDAQSRSANTNISLTVTGGGTTHSPDEHLVMGNPSNAAADVNQPFNYLMPKNQYVLSYHRDRAIPNWVAWHLDATWLGSTPRQDDYRPDPAVPAGWYQVQSSSYSGSGFDRGHHAPSADRTSSVADNSATFLMTNFMPQAPGNNQGPWERLESDSRVLVGGGNELYIVAGGYGTGGTGDNGFASTVDAGRVAVPAFTWKVILVLPVGDNDVSRVDANTRAIAVIMPNDTAIRPDAWQKYLATVDQVEALTGYDFFSNVPVSIQNQIESRLDAASNTAPQTVSGGTYANLNVANRPNVTLTGDVTVTGNLDLGASIINTGSFKITLAPGASVSRISGYVVGQIEKQFDDPNAPDFVFPVGTQNGYSPVTADLTALGAVPSSLTVKAAPGAHPQASNPNLALQRYWTLTEAGDLTANLTFQYLQPDVPSGVSDENTLRIFRFESGFSQLPTTLDAAANTARTGGVSQFSDWTLLVAAGPTAAGVNLDGRVINANGRGIGRVTVTLTDQSGAVRTAVTNPFGYYRFTDVPAGATYVLSAAHKRYTFAAQTVNAGEDVSNLILVGIEP